MSEALTIRTTSTGVKVIEGDCPHCGHRAMDHWESGCKASPRSDHCRMDPWKLERAALTALVPHPGAFLARFFVEAQGMLPSRDDVTRIEWRYLTPALG